MSIEHVRSAFERWYAAATSQRGIGTALDGIASDDCITHLQNGEVGSRAITDTVAAQASAMYPDLSVEIEHVALTDDRMLVQLELSGTPSLVFRIARGLKTFHAFGAVVARVNDRAEIVETWQYLSPGAVLTFPPTPNPVAPPIPSSPAGDEADAMAVARMWARASTGPEFRDRLLSSTLTDCLVHTTNGDLGRNALIEEHFQIVLSAFPDLTVAFEEPFAAGDRLALQFMLDGTQRGQLGIAPPSGARVQSTGLVVARVTPEQRVQELWLYLAPAMGLVFPRRDR